MKQILIGLVLSVAVMVSDPTLAAGPAPVDLGSAAPFAILAGSAITSTGGGAVNGDVGLSPATGDNITGLTSNQVNGIIYVVNAAGPAGRVVDPGLLATAKVDLVTAYNDAASRSVDRITVSGDIGGQTLTNGLYWSASSLAITGDLTLDAQGDSDAVWIFQMTDSTLTTATGSRVILANGAQARNIFWQVGTSATLGTFSVFKGTIMADQSITMGASSTIEGRLLASNAAVTFNGNLSGIPTLARLIRFGGFTRDGTVMIAWETVEEIDSAGFFLERRTGGSYERINAELMPAQLFGGDFVTYEQADPGAQPGGAYVYRLIEQELSGALRYLGPYLVTIDGETLSFDEWSRTMFDPDAVGNLAVTGEQADPDGDGMSNMAEFMAGTNPMDRGSALRMRALNPTKGGGISLQWLSESNRIYTIERSTNFPSGGFESLIQGVSATPPVNSWMDSTPATMWQGIYRIRVE